MKGMTGFGVCERRDEKRHVSVFLKSYNNRFLELYVFLPVNLMALEQRIREFLASRIQRGRVELSLKLTEYEEELEIILDRKCARSYIQALQQLAVEAGIAEPLKLGHLLKVDGVLKIEKNQGLEEIWTALLPLIEGAFAQFEQMRIREGEATERDIQRILVVIEEGLETVKRFAAEIERKIKEDLRQRFIEVLGNGVDENRLLAETALILMKYDVNEEQVRLRSHLDHFRTVLREAGPVGKKLDFLCQEMNREVNTIGSKCLIIEVNQAVIAMKDALEKIREQIRNVE